MIADVKQADLVVLNDFDDQKVLKKYPFLVFTTFIRSFAFSLANSSKFLAKIVAKNLLLYFIIIITAKRFPLLDIGLPRSLLIFVSKLIRKFNREPTLPKLRYKTI